MTERFNAEEVVDVVGDWERFVNGKRWRVHSIHSPWIETYCSIVDDDAR